MIINKPIIRTEKDEIIISSKIEFENESVTKELWFEVPKSYKKYISKSSDAFLVALVHLAMSKKEDIELKGFISPKLAYNIKKYQAIYNSWFPKEFKIINIKANELKTEKKVSKAVCCSFSGGVDSFYTLIKHLPKNQPIKEYQLTHALFIQGFDIPLEEKERLNHLTKSYKKLMDNLGIKLLTIKTNILDIVHIENLKFPLTFGGILISSALILNNLISQFYIASTDRYSDMLPYGADPLTDHLLSTEKIEIHHDIGEERIKKILEISKFPETYNHLRVCYKKNKINNCCKCEKCIRTMIALKTVGVLSKYKTFPNHLARNIIRNNLTPIYDFSHLKRNIDYAKKINDKKMLFDLKYSIIRSSIINKTKDILIPLWKISAKLKKKSKTYEKAIKLIKNE